MIKRALILTLAASPCAFAQEAGNVIYQTAQSGGQVALQAGPVTSVAWGAVEKAPSSPVQGAPYSATVKNESIQTLADGNRIVQTSTGTMARDSQGRTRHDAPLPAIGNLSAADAPHIVFIQDPVAKTSYTLNLTEKIAQKMPALSPMVAGASPMAGAVGGATVRVENGVSISTSGPLPEPPMVMQRSFVGTEDESQVSTEDLGSQTMEGVLVTGVRTTRTIPAGQIGNERPISIVTEVWTSPDLKAVVYSKRSDPRMGEQTFQLTNLVRAEPNPSLFTVPADFKIVDGPQPVIYRPKQ